jgi:hypothetical protein
MSSNWIVFEFEMGSLSNESNRPENSEAKNLRSNSFEQRTVFWSGYLRKRSTSVNLERLPAETSYKTSNNELGSFRSNDF